VNTLTETDTPVVENGSKNELFVELGKLYESIKKLEKAGFDLAESIALLVVYAVAGGLLLFDIMGWNNVHLSFFEILVIFFILVVTHRIAKE
jgi:hypothetical protein